MGKYMRKGKGVGKMEVSQGTLVGVRTRARALAMEKQRVLGNLTLLHQSFTTSANTASSSKASESSCHAFPTQPLYMELRSRRLEKAARSEKDKATPETLDTSQKSAREHCDDRSSSKILLPLSAELHSFDEERCTFWLQTGSCSIHGSDSTSQNRLPPRNSSLCKPVAATASSTHSPTVSISQKKSFGILTRNRSQELAYSSSSALNPGASIEKDTTLTFAQQADPCSKRDMEVELCFGESPIVAGIFSKERESEHLSSRRTRECTPDSFIRDLEPPGSTSRTRPSCSQARPLSTPMFARCRQSPSCNEIEAFFSSAEQQERRRFINRFNFDPLLERPMRGRYEWFDM